MKLPWLKFYPRDWLGDMQLRQCSVESRGVWFEMLCIMHCSKRRGRLEDSAGNKIGTDMLARLIGMNKGDLYRCMDELKAHGVPDIDADGTWINRRMYRDESKREACSLAGKKGGGNPVLKSESDKTDIPETPDTRGAYKGTYKGASSGDDGFEQFWAQYPRKAGKRTAMKAWKRADKPALKVIIEKLNTLKASDQWMKDGGQFIPHPATWINRGGWDDEPTVTNERKSAVLSCN